MHGQLTCGWGHGGHFRHGNIDHGKEDDDNDVQVYETRGSTVTETKDNGPDMQISHMFDEE